MDFKNESEVGSGAAASVFTVNWKNSVFAIKKFNKILSMKEITNEIDLMKKVNTHPNIIKFGESQDILQIFPVPFKRVLFWELTSRSPPFDSEELTLIDIVNGKREKPIPNTNPEFVKLYKECWKHEPDERPVICQYDIDEKQLHKEMINNINEGLELAILDVDLLTDKKSLKDEKLLNRDSKHHHVNVSLDDSIMEVNCSSLSLTSLVFNYPQKMIYLYENQVST
ncbi:14352_t:CDS:2 [Funneliformis caledonium]|uniref:14352_t:CDS:1 n=1 Tax=Funneliformis caledonium TaxID=1117310 RepID=A0A9N8V7R0_9GLOM|nr:14352_t:CDS:2 [Funneliformis caledonium]